MNILRQFNKIKNPSGSEIKEARRNNPKTDFVLGSVRNYNQTTGRSFYYFMCERSSCPNIWEIPKIHFLISVSTTKTISYDLDTEEKKLTIQ